MSGPSLARRIVAGGLGTALLLAAAMGVALLASACKDIGTSTATASSTRAPAGPAAVALLPAVAASLASLQAGFDAVPPERKQSLEKLALFVRARRSSGETARLLFICTHNSRRSHLGQVWASAAAAYYGVDGVEAYSGGTETSAFNPRAMAALERAGFQLASPGGDNPHVMVTYARGRPPLEAFSKKYDDPFNPKEGFAAVMTCSVADKACPIVHGSSLRVVLPYDDPKAADGTPEESAVYDRRSRQIGTEMMYLFSRVKG